MKRIISLLFIFILINSIFAQDTLYKVSGKVIDEKTKLLISNVAVQIYGTLYGTATDSTGHFKFSIKDKDVLFKFSIIGYEDKYVRVNYKAYNGFTITLPQKTNLLKEVVINGSPIETVVKSEDSNILDYEFYDDNILLITYRNDLTKSKLYLLSPSFDTLSRLKIPEEPTGLFKDCLGNNHIVCENSLYQIYLDSAFNLSLLPAQSIKKFADLLYSCVAEDSLNLYFIKKTGSKLIPSTIGAPIKTHNHTIDYFYFNKLNKKSNHLVNIVDEKTKELREGEQRLEKQKEAAGMYETEHYKITIGGGPGQDRYFLETIAIKEVFAPLYKLNNKIYVFDYINSNISNYSSKGELLSKVDIEFHKTKPMRSWKREMCVDEKTGKAFAIFELNGTTTIKEINITNGQINQSYQIPFSFVKKIKAHDNYIYFLYKGAQYSDTRYLSRLKIN
jgi:carboxypeptidase-like protein